MRKFFSKAGLVALLGTALVSAAPIAAPDTADITGSISNMVQAGLLVIVAFISAKWGVRALKALVGF